MSSITIVGTGNMGTAIGHVLSAGEELVASGKDGGKGKSGGKDGAKGKSLIGGLSALLPKRAKK